MKILRNFLMLLSVMLWSLSTQAQDTDLPFKIKAPQSYVHEGDSVVLEGAMGDSAFVVYFADDFQPAAPPMVENPYYGQSNMKVDTVLRVSVTEPVYPSSKGLVFFQQDTATVQGVGLAVVPEDFPKYRKLKNLTASMVYISSKEEMLSLSNSPDMKQVFENFWLNLGGGRENASRLISVYFRRVSEANRRFTNYKEGWKTDQGIVYIIFGEPDQINPTLEGEDWVYSENPNHREVSFSFVKKKNIFSGNHYELIRDPKFRKLWFDTVKRWRNGTIQ
ncbi:GWxTD domain-containing protein [Limibacter armeniacum]|uniref:GWxTD domain-containing protein n=1 Tax=Limibacter armeniacum TaxID=466084 RepID=UPI002FE670B3